MPEKKTVVVVFLRIWVVVRRWSCGGDGWVMVEGFWVGVLAQVIMGYLFFVFILARLFWHMNMLRYTRLLRDYF